MLAVRLGIAEILKNLRQELAILRTENKKLTNRIVVLERAVNEVLMSRLPRATSP